MIDYEKSAELNGMEVEELKVYFEKYLQSNKRVIRICDNCEDENEMSFQMYKPLCQKCFLKTPESRLANSKGQVKRWSNPEERKAQAKRTSDYAKSHPEAVEKHTKWMIEHCKDSEVLKAMSERTIEQFSTQEARDAQREAGKVGTEKFIGGNDIVNHHFIYDHANPENHTVEITRSQHMAHHAWMKRNGLKVPHINDHIPWRY